MKRYSTDTNTIYLLTNKVNGKIYVGQSWMKLSDRMGSNGSGYINSVYLYNAIQKHGVDNFEYQVLEICYDQETADRLESKYIEQYNARNLDIGYNIKEGGSAGKHSQETKDKIAQAMTGREVSEVTRNKISKIHKGLKKPAHTQESKQAVSEAMIEWHATHEHPMLGTHHKEESRQAIGAAAKGRKHSPESVARRAEKIRMAPERSQGIVQAYQNMVPIEQIMDDFKTSASSIYRQLKLHNIPKHGQSEAKKIAWANKKSNNSQ